MTALLIVARFVHIICGVYWVGTVFFINLYLGPSLGASGPAGASVTRELMRRKYSEFTVIMATLTIIAGLFLVWQDSAHFDPSWFRTRFGMALSTGMVAAIIAYLMFLFMAKPLLNRMSALGSQLGQGGSNNPELMTEFDAVRDKMIRYSAVIMLLLLLAVTTMAVARYL